MEWSDIVKLISLLLAIFGTVYAALRFVLTEQNKRSELTIEVEQLKKRIEVVTTAFREEVNHFQEVQGISSSAQTAIGADLHSISIPVPRENPTHLKIIISTDPDADKIIGKEFPIFEGLAGKVFADRTPGFVRRALDNPDHFKTIDEAAGTKTGEGPILSYPLMQGEICVGVAQFMREPGRASFVQEDLVIVSRFVKKISRKLVELEEAVAGDPRIGSIERTYVSLLFTDINDYSIIAKDVSLYQEVSILNEYYNRMWGTAQQHGASLEEYLGDGVYLSFHGDTKYEAVRSAIYCAIDMQKSFDKLREEWRAFQFPFSAKNYHNIGIASGYVFEGTIGHHQQRRRKLIGSAVNEAAHLVEYGKPLGGCILVDEETHLTAALLELTQRHKNKDFVFFKVKETDSQSHA